jgi:hypothetical protein
MVSVLAAAATVLQAQNKIDEERMERDIEVTENVLSTLIRQQFNKRNFFPFEVEGNYSPGYGVTFRLPMDLGGPLTLALSAPRIEMNSGPGGSYSYSISSTGDEESKEDCVDCDKVKLKNKVNTVHVKGTRNDSLSQVMNQKIIAASSEFIADYGDLISQLSPEERIKITNRHEGQRFWYAGANMPKRRFISLECTRADITQFKQGKLTRDQLMAKINIVDSETSDELSPDLELLSSIFNRLYRPDLSKSYYTQENIYYERLKDYGVIYYMQVVSSVESDYKKFNMPTIDLEDIDKETRDKKVTELYPLFEKDVKESMLEYGRTVKSLKDNEMLIFNIKLTKCEGCRIPSSLELSVKNAVLEDFSNGKLTKEAAMAKINVKKGPNQ